MPKVDISKLKIETEADVGKFFKTLEINFVINQFNALPLEKRAELIGKIRAGEGIGRELLFLLIQAPKGSYSSFIKDETGEDVDPKLNAGGSQAEKHVLRAAIFNLHFEGHLPAGDSFTMESIPY
ncbi:MAG: hypothetical protein ABSB00_02575 [Minisyncoccia bacterium]|jgi:uncharacterized protein involved in high-affinity Fe2+ transport